MSCKSCINDLGEFPHNVDLELPGILAAQNGEHVIRFNFGGTIRYIKLDLTAGDEFVIPKKKLNEDFTYDFTIIQPDGTTLKKDDCENFVLKTYIANDGSCSPAACGDAVDPIYGYL